MKTGTIILLTILLVSANSAANPSVLVVANDIDHALAKTMYTTLMTAGANVTRITAMELPMRRDGDFIIILGGHRAPQGVGEVVSTLLTSMEKRYLEGFESSSQVFPRNNNTLGRPVYVAAGYDREQTRKAWLRGLADFVEQLRMDDGTLIEPEDSGQYECSDYCTKEGFSAGTCRMNAFECIQNRETRNPSGSRYCPHRAWLDTCCCKP